MKVDVAYVDLCVSRHLKEELAWENGFMLLVIYHIAQNFDVFDAFQLDRQNLTRQIV